MLNVGSCTVLLNEKLRTQPEHVDILPIPLLHGHDQTIIKFASQHATPSCMTPSHFLNQDINKTQPYLPCNSAFLTPGKFMLPNTKSTFSF